MNKVIFSNQSLLTVFILMSLVFLLYQNDFVSHANRLKVCHKTGFRKIILNIELISNKIEKKYNQNMKELKLRIIDIFN
jgi:hypothetical protein